MTKERKKIVERLRAEGEAAYHAGKSYGSNPYSLKVDGMDYFQWCRGWEYAHDTDANTETEATHEEYIDFLARLTDEGRVDAFVGLRSRFCLNCGSTDAHKCTCMADD